MINLILMKRSRSTSLLVILSAVLALFIQSCGPMNAKPPGTSSADTTDGCGPGNGSSGESIGFSQNHSFVVRARVSDAAQHGIVKPHLNDNAYEFRIFHGADLTAVSKDTAVSIQYIHTSAPIPRSSTAVVQKRDDGSYASTLTFKRPGTWEVHVHVTEGATDDEHVFQVTI